MPSYVRILESPAVMRSVSTPWAKFRCSSSMTVVPFTTSRVVIEYLDSLGTPPLIPAAIGERWATLRLQALADGLLESTIRVWLEGLRPEPERRADFVEWETMRIKRVLAALEREPRTGPYFGPEFGVADIVVGVALEYVDLRAPLNWRTWCPALVAWLAPISARPSFQRTALASDP